MRRFFALFFGVLALLVGAALISGAVTVFAADKDDDGFYVTEEHRFAQASHAITADDIEVLSDAPSWLTDWFTDLVDFRMVGVSNTGQDVFLGIASSAEVDGYLTAVAHHEVDNVSLDPFEVDYTLREGATIPDAPAPLGIWEASVTGPGNQTLDWEVESGTWSVVVMNADASAGVDVTLVVGAKVSYATPLTWSALGVGVILVLGGGYLMYRGLRRPIEEVPPTAPPAELEEPGPARPEPTGVEGSRH